MAASANPLGYRSGTAIVLGACAVFVIGAWFARLHGTAGAWWSDIWWVATSGAAGVACWRASRRVVTPSIKAAWRWFALACGAWFVGAVWWATAELLLGVATPFPTGADAFFMVFNPLLVTGAWHLRRVDRPRGLSLALAADVGMMSAAALLPTVLMLRDATARTSGDAPYVAVAIGYTVLASAAFLVTLLWTLGAGRAGRHGPLPWLTIAVAALALADFVYAYQLLTGVYLTGGLVDVLWVVPFVSIAFAAHATVAEPGRTIDDAATRPSRVDAVAPSVIVCVCLALAGVFAADAEPVTRIVTMASGVTIMTFIGLRALASWRLEQAYHEEAERRRAAGRALDAQLATLAQHNAIATLASGISHDFNNLLQAMTGQLALARRRAGRGEDPQSALDDAERALGRASELSARLLALGRRDADEPMVLDGEALVTRVAASVRSVVPTGVTVEVHAEPDVRVMVGRAEFEVALLNLGLNARDALVGRRGTIGFTVERAGAIARFVVDDDGVGMTAEVAARAAEPYFTTKAPGRGAGLGLTFVSSLASRSRGQLRLVARASGGTRAVLELPVAAADAATSGSGATLDAVGTALVLAGTDASDLALVGALERAGFDVVHVPSVGAAALLVASGEPIEVAIVDVARFDHDASHWAALRAPHVAHVVALAASAIDIPAGVTVIAKPAAPADVVARIVAVRAQVDAIGSTRTSTDNVSTPPPPT